MRLLKHAVVAVVAAAIAVLPIGQVLAERYYDPVADQWVTIDEGGRPINASLRQSTRRGGATAIKRQVVEYSSNYRPGTIVVEQSKFRLYFILDGDTAISYGIGVGRDGFRWSGTHHISRKAEWPGWTPPPAMRKRQPELPAYMPGGPGNPLGARALYIGATLYRLHGTSDPRTIGHNVSSGCIRLTNEDIIDLYDRVNVGTLVVIRL